MPNDTLARIYLVRHGKAAAGFGSHPDPGLDATGQAQSLAVAELLRSRIASPLPLYSSPLARAWETAQPLAQAWQCEVSIESRVAEVPTPVTDLADRAAWLKRAMAGSWEALDPSLQQWRQDLHDCLREQQHDCVMFSHYVAINAAVGLAQGNPDMHIFAPDNCSVTVIENHADKLIAKELGTTAQTHIN